MSKNKNLINDRAENLLKTLIQEYIKQGQPIGSKTLSTAGKIELSSASIRNVLSDLEKMGFIHSPHRSAGRIPTIQGYRYFVDSLLTIEPMDKKVVQNFIQDLACGQGTQEIVASASEFLSNMTSFAGVVTIPKRQVVELKQIEFLPLSDNRVLSILVTNDFEVQNRILPMSRKFKVEELERAANYLNHKFGGQEISRIRAEIMAEMDTARKDVDQKMRTAVEMANSVFNDKASREKEDFVLAGQTKLMDHNDLASVDSLKQLFEAFNQKRDILHLLDQCLNSDGVQIFIGEESGYEVLGDCSVVTKNYTLDDQVIGSLGVIGPTRMPYDKVISIVDLTAKILSSALNSK